MAVPMIGADQDFSGKTPQVPGGGGDNDDQETLGVARRIWRGRYRGLMCLLLVPLLVGCVDGVSPAAPCPVAVVYVSVHGGELVTDSVDYTPEC